MLLSIISKKGTPRPLNTLAHMHIRTHTHIQVLPQKKKTHIHKYLEDAQPFAIERRALANQRKQGDRGGS